jgi:hypothetical protein
MTRSRYLLILGFAAALSMAAKGCTDPVTTILYAQTLPVTVHADWTPNQGTVVQYSVTTDGGTPVIVKATDCTPTDCLAPITVTSYGSHTTSVVAQNFTIDSDPTTIQSSDPATVTWSLNPSPSAVTKVKIKN